MAYPARVEGLVNIIILIIWMNSSIYPINWTLTDWISVITMNDFHIPWSSRTKASSSDAILYRPLVVSVLPLYSDVVGVLLAIKMVKRPDCSTHNWQRENTSSSFKSMFPKVYLYSNHYYFSLHLTLFHSIIFVRSQKRTQPRRK